MLSRFNPDASIVKLDQFLAQSQADPRSAVLIPLMQAFEQVENPNIMLWSNADAIVPDTEPPVAFQPFRIDVDERLGLLIFYRVVDQMPENKRQRFPVRPDDGE